MAKLGGAALALLLAACGAKVDHETAGGESHFLASCSGSCDDALTCIAELCSDACEVDADCQSLNPGARCLSAGNGVRSCDLECTTNNDCDSLGSGFVCDASRCRQSPEDPPVSTCQEGGQTYAEGARWQCSDGCNTCTCGSDGSVESTLVGCPEPTTCQEASGDVYFAGDTWRCADQCADCTCNDDGTITREEESNCASPIQCTLAGESYATGETTRCADGCNTCICIDDGTWQAMTQLDCTPFPPVACVEGGVAHSPGDTWPCSDGCNTCTCDSDGQVITTDIACAIDAGATPPECALAPEVGDCDAAFEKFYFDVALGECRSFTYGGCGGNANRYDSLEACTAACTGDAG